MRPTKPVKKWAIGLRVSSKLNRSFNYVEFANPNTFDSQEEAQAYIESQPNWNRHRTLVDPTIKNSNVGPFELTDEEVIELNR
jgi:hypothetical protein